MDQLRSEYQSGGFGGTAASVRQYLAWRLSGSPPEPAGTPTERLDQARAAAVVALMRDHFSETVPGTSPLVSIILPTKDRPDTVRRAIESVVAQSYQNWELVVVNDGSTLLNEQGSDGRINTMPSQGSGVGAARNTGLDAARGDWVAFLDDDNVMDRHWVNSIVVASEDAPDAEVLIGAQLVAPEPGSGDTYFVRHPDHFDWHALTEANYVDMGMLAHKSRPDIRFDEDLAAFLDWDYVVRLTATSMPALVPSLSGIYQTGSSSRISYTDRRQLRGELQERFHTLSAPRVEDSASPVGAHDLRAIRVMLRRLSSEAARPLKVGMIGRTAPVTTVAASIVDLDGVEIEQFADVDAFVSRGDIDVAIIDGQPPELIAGGIHEGSVVVGLSAESGRYDSTSLVLGRRIGDQLWIGSTADLALELLFDGATLVKLGVDG